MIALYEQARAKALDEMSGRKVCRAWVPAQVDICVKAGIAAALDHVEQEARRRAEAVDSDSGFYGNGEWDAYTALAEFCRSQRGTP